MLKALQSTKRLVRGLASIVIGGLASPVCWLQAEIWPNYRGAEGNGILNERIQLEWSKNEPNVLWRQYLNHGFSSITVANGKAFTQVRRRIDGEDSEVCLALDLENGNELWATPVGPAGYASGPAGPSGGSDGPRSTPVIHDDRVFVLSAQLGLSCLSIENGQVIWSKDLKREYRGRIPKWANAASPVIDGDMLLLNTGASANSLLALRTADGEEVWRQGSEGSTYATPVCAEIHGIPQVIFLTRRGLVSVAPDSGDELWSYEFGNNERFCASPVVAGDIVYASGGYDIGAAAVRIGKTGEQLTVTELWRKPGELMNHWTTSVHYDGYLYGMFGSKAYNVAPLKCIKIETGEEMWSQRGFGNGSLLLAGDKLLALRERREVLVVDTDPTAYTELAKMTPFDNTRGKVWNTPAVSEGRLYL